MAAAWELQIVGHGLSVALSVVIIIELDVEPQRLVTGFAS
jgi:hypothetical protein